MFYCKLNYFTSDLAITTRQYCIAFIIKAYIKHIEFTIKAYITKANIFTSERNSHEQLDTLLTYTYLMQLFCDSLKNTIQYKTHISQSMYQYRIPFVIQPTCLIINCNKENISMKILMSTINIYHALQYPTMFLVKHLLHMNLSNNAKKKLWFIKHCICITQ